MITIDLRHNLDETAKVIAAQGKQVKFAAAVALTKTAEVVRESEYAEMRNVFDRPTPYTMRSLFLKGATKETLTATVWLKDDFSGGGHYLRPQIQGGARVPKRFEQLLARSGVLPQGWVAVPASGARFDAFGNMERVQLLQILAYLQSFGEQGYKANITAKGRAKLAKGTKAKQGIAYFVSGREKGKALPLGIWQRTYFASGTSIRPVLLFYSQVKYRAIFGFDVVGQRVASAEFPKQYQPALQRAMETAK